MKKKQKKRVKYVESYLEYIKYSLKTKDPSVIGSLSVKADE